jgi:hypothetical protein
MTRLSRTLRRPRLMAEVAAATLAEVMSDLGAR